MRKLFVLFNCVVLFSCSGIPTGKTAIAPVYLDDKKAYRLLMPFCVEKDIDMQQQILGTYQGREFIFESFVIADKSRITMIIYNSMGVEIGRFDYDGKNIAFASDFFPQSIKPEYIAADFQFVFYNFEELENALKNSGLSIALSQDKNEGGAIVKETRQIRNADNLIIEISKTPTEITYTNYLRSYAYTLRGYFE
jgi:hypothetical protein